MTQILIVEDSVDILLILQMELQWRGYAVHTAADAATGLDLVCHIRPDVIVSDLRMPEMDGFEFIRRVRQFPELTRVPAIALTGFSDENQIRFAITSGFTTHITKPVEPAELVKTIDQLTTKKLQRVA